MGIWQASYHQCYRFNFVNRERQYILRPDDVKIYTLEAPYVPREEVLSIEQSLEKAKATSFYSDATGRDHTAEPPGSPSSHTLECP